MQSALGAALTITEGYVAPAVERAYARAWELCHQFEDLTQLLPVAGLCRHAVVKGEHRKGEDLAQRMLRLAEGVGDRRLFMYAHGMLGYVLFWCGDFAQARTHLEKSRDLYDFEQDRFLPFVYGDDSNVAALAFLAFIDWLEGHVDRSLEQSRESVELARRLDHPSVLTLALMLAAELRRLRGEAAAADASAAESLTLASEHGLSLFAAVNGLLRGWALADQGELTGGIAALRRSLDAYRVIGADSGLPQYHAMLAEAHLRAGQTAEGLDVVRMRARDHGPDRRALVGSGSASTAGRAPARGFGERGGRRILLRPGDRDRARSARAIARAASDDEPRASVARSGPDDGSRADPGGDPRLLHRRPRYSRSRRGRGAPGGSSSRPARSGTRAQCGPTRRASDRARRPASRQRRARAGCRA